MPAACRCRYIRRCARRSWKIICAAQSGILANCRATMLITITEAKTLARLLQTQLETLRLVTTVADLQASQARFHAPPLHGDDLAFIQYTSGSTGNPKGVMLSHANLLANIRADGEAIRADSSDVFVSWLPLYHDMGMIGAWLGSLYFAAHLVIMSPLKFLTRPSRWLRAIHQHRATRCRPRPTSPTNCACRK